MRKSFLLLFAFALLCVASYAKEDKDSLTNAIMQQMKLIDSVNKVMKYETGSVLLTGNFAKLNVPGGFKYLNAEQSKYVLNKLWGNPPRTDILGMIFPADGGPFADSSYAFIISYDEAGFVKDDDADKINYDDLLKDIQKDEAEENKTRIAEGYDAIHMVGWAAKPYYDKTSKVLHWAKELRFGDAEGNTLNYEVRILGRKGILSLNAVATMSELNMVKKDIDKVLQIPTFNEGFAYKDFDSKIDNVAAWTIGGLVAGKVLLKVGFFAILAKFFIAGWKFILLGIVGAWGAIKKFFGKKTSDGDTVA